MSDLTSIVRTLCNGIENPLGVDQTPSFSWSMKSTKKGNMQVQYQLFLYDSHENSLLNDAFIKTSIIPSNQNTFISFFDILQLQPNTQYFWKVCIWDSDDHIFESEINNFRTGKMNELWNGQWIGASHVKTEDDSHAAPYFSKKITINKVIKTATLYICGVGYYEAFIEGVKISKAVLEPAYTKYDTTLYYATYDVLHLITQQDITIGVILGNGWYNYFENDQWHTKFASWKAFPKMMLELHLEYTDQTTEVISTDDSWKSAKSPIIYNAIRNGEHYDARNEIPNWDKSFFDDSDWSYVKLVRSPGGEILTTQMPSIEVTDIVPVKSYWKTNHNTWIFDFGQNFAGKSKLISTGKKDTQVTLNYSEALTEDGNAVHTEYLSGFIKSGEFQTEKYIKSTDFPEEWSSKFVYHGFRYIEISGMECVDEHTLMALVMHTNFEDIGDFTCSDQDINDIQNMCYWSTVSNFYGIPTDCPHREKNSWTGDSSLISEQLLLNFDATLLLKKWLRDIKDSQRENGSIPCIVPSPGWGYNWGNGPDWSKAISEVPWNIYLYTGDKSILEEYYPCIEKHFDFMVSMSKNSITEYGIGDWCAPFDGEALSINMGNYKAPLALTDTACFYYSASILSKIQNILNYPNTYQVICDEIKTAWEDKFIDYSTDIVQGDCQTSYGFALYYEFHSDLSKMLAKLLDTIKHDEFHINYGILGSKCVMHALGEHGEIDTIYKMIKQTTYPGYLYLKTLGRTTLGECWNGKGSQNHMMFSDISAIFYKYIAGIRVDEENPGFKHFTIGPALFDKLTHLDCSYKTLHGEILISWKKVNNNIELNLDIPVGTTAQFILPNYVINQQSYSQILVSGTHKFHFQI